MAKLLLMEDDVEFSFRLQRDLEDAGHDVETRFSASEAISTLKNTPFDLVITDIIVLDRERPVPDGGISLVSWIRNTSQQSETPIIAITGSHKNPGMSDILSLARSVGANDVLEKPFVVADMLGMIERLIAARDAAQPDGTH